DLDEGVRPLEDREERGDDLVLHGEQPLLARDHLLLEEDAVEVAVRLLRDLARALQLLVGDGAASAEGPRRRVRAPRPHEAESEPTRGGVDGDRDSILARRQVERPAAPEEAREDLERARAARAAGEGGLPRGVEVLGLEELLVERGGDLPQALDLVRPRVEL